MIGMLLSWLLSGLCPTETAWIERDPSGAWVHECGDADGNPVGINGWDGPRILAETIIEFGYRGAYVGEEMATRVATLATPVARLLVQTSRR